MTSFKGPGPKKLFWPIRLKPSKPFRRQLTDYIRVYAEKLLHELFSNISRKSVLHELFSNISRKKCPTLIGRTKLDPYRVAL